MFTVRKANETDLSGVANLSEIWVSECITYGLGANTEELLRNNIGDYFWVAEINSEIVGYITGSAHVSDGLAVIEQGEHYLDKKEPARAGPFYSPRNLTITAY